MLKLVFVTVSIAVVGALDATGSPFISTLDPDSKIVGGEEVSIKDFPYQLSLVHNGAHLCGASIIAPLWALTAAHCALFPVYFLTLRSGSDIVGTGSIHLINESIIHSKYDARTIDYNVALLKVIKPFIFGPGVAPIALHDQDATVASGANVTVSGWGALTYNSCLPSHLRAVSIPIVNETHCQKIWAGKITPRMICAGGLPEGGNGVCNGDAGGPLVMDVSGVKTLVGIVSFGTPCTIQNRPDVYTRVASVRDWIKEKSGV